ncbi:uncharacterized protein [Drosophila kikkawai]|uniref:Uncharacterized protein n=1 Tax=Drosophila kikkawai TaxID=30033 RepID=A0A6P4IID9_DROKI|nr:uncharacterized protein LOC108078665 [Drosophila kikkawai]KAH8342896.1 hypothetical protein KR059_001373 [Drosophila kikkawai]
MQLIYTTLVLGLLSATLLEAAILPLTLIKESVNYNQALPMDTEKFGYLEVKPNGSLFLRKAPSQGGNNRQNLLMLRGILQALKITPFHISEAGGQTRLDLKIYGDGVEHKFPPILENIIRRIQTYFSVYRYSDTSQPLQRVEISTLAAEESPNVTTLQPPDEDELIAIGEQDAYITVGEDADALHRSIY